MSFTARATVTMHNWPRELGDLQRYRAAMATTLYHCALPMVELEATTLLGRLKTAMGNKTDVFFWLDLVRFRPTADVQVD